MLAKHKPRQLAILVNILIFLGGASTDIYLPSLPALAQFFNCPNNLVQLTITAFALGSGIGQIFIGPIADACGRKQPLLIGIIIQCLSVIGILIATTIKQFILIRFFQGLGVALMMVPARAIISDIYHGEALKKNFAYITISFSLSPIVSPFIGGLLQSTFNWKANFILLISCLLLMLLMSIWVEETIPHKNKLSVPGIKSSYSYVLCKKFFFPSVLLSGSLISFVSLYNVVSPFVIQNQLHKSALFYGNISLIMGSAWFLGGLSSNAFERYTLEQKSFCAFLILVIIGGIMVALQIRGLSLLKFILPTYCLIFSAGFVFPAYIGTIMRNFSQYTASANGLLFCGIWLAFGFYSFVGSLLKSKTTIPLAITYTLIALFLLFYYKKVIRHLNDEKPTVT